MIVLTYACVVVQQSCFNAFKRSPLYVTFLLRMFLRSGKMLQDDRPSRVPLRPFTTTPKSLL
jgi:hypothetical protein